MLFSRKAVVAAIAFAQGVMSFGDTSPQIFISSSREVDNGLKKSQFSSFIINSSDFDKNVGAAVSDCTADAYIFVNQPALHSYDLSESSTSNLRAFFEKAASKYLFPHVSMSQDSIPADAQDDISPLAKEVINKCGAQVIDVDTKSTSFEGYTDTTPRAIVLNFPTLPSIKDKSDRAAALEHNDNLLGLIVSSLPSDNYVIVYTSVAESGKQVASRLSKKDQIAGTEEDVLGDALMQKNVAADQEEVGELKVGDSLFEKYQYFSPGIFESTLVALALIFIFFTAFSWITTLEISYNAFEKPPQIPTASKAQ